MCFFFFPFVCPHVCRAVSCSGPTSHIKVCWGGIAHALGVVCHALVLPLVRLLAVFDLQCSCRWTREGSLVFVQKKTCAFSLLLLLYLRHLCARCIFLFQFDPWGSLTTCCFSNLYSVALMLFLRLGLNGLHSPDELCFVFVFSFATVPPPFLNK